MTKLGAFILTPVGFAAGGLIGAAVGETLAGVPLAYGDIRPITKQEQKGALTGGAIGALVGATLVAILGANPEPPKTTSTLSGPPQFLGFP